MLRISLALALLLVAFLVVRGAYAQDLSVHEGEPPGIASEKPPPLKLEPTEKLVPKPRDARPPVRFTLAPDSDLSELNLYAAKSINPILGPMGKSTIERFEPLCTLPCEVTLRHGAHLFSVSSGTRGHVAVSPILQLREGDEVQIHYQSRRLQRILGWTLLLAGTAAGSILLGSGLQVQKGTMPGRVAGGAVMMAASLGFGLWFSNMRDLAHGEVFGGSTPKAANAPAGERRRASF